MAKLVRRCSVATIGSRFSASPRAGRAAWPLRVRSGRNYLW